MLAAQISTRNGEPMEYCDNCGHDRLSHTNGACSAMRIATGGNCDCEMWQGLDSEEVS